MLDRRKALGFGVAACIAPARLFAATDEVMATHGLALGGIDPLSYWLDGSPLPGTSEHRIIWRDAIWIFSDKSRLDAFERNPVGLAPAYGGYCAYALSQGVVAVSDPQIFTLIDNRLFLNQSDRSRSIWLGNVDSHVVTADSYWPQILG